MVKGRQVRHRAMEAGANVGGAGEHNRRVILKALRLNGPLSRAEIARGTGLVPQTVSNIMFELEGEGLVRPAETVRGRRGQPAIPYRLAPNGVFALGLQIDQYGARGSAIDQLGNLVATTEVSFAPVGLEGNLGNMRAAIARLRTDLKKKSPDREPRILGLGLAMPAPTGVHVLTADPWMTATRTAHPIVAALAEATGLTVSLHHDGAAAAVAEKLNGVAKGIENFVLIFVGYGLGAGIHVHGTLHDGHHHLAGELGQIPVPTADGMVPLEQVASLAPLYSRLRLLPHEGFSFSRIEAAMTTDKDAVADWLDSAALQFGWLADVLNCILDPDCIVLGGQMPEALLKALFARIEAAGGSRFPDRGVAKPRLVMGSADVFSVAAGAAAYPLARAFDPSLSAFAKGGRLPLDAADAASV